VRSRRRGLRVEEQVYAVALDKERVVVSALIALQVAPAGLVVEGPVCRGRPRGAQPKLSMRHCSSVLPKRYGALGRGDRLEAASSASCGALNSAIWYALVCA
jgi:hypothetical protein